MKLIENRVANDDLHEELLHHDPFPRVWRGKLCGELLLAELLAEDDNNVSAYRFRVEDMVSEFIRDNVRQDTKKFDRSGEKLALAMIANLKSMISSLRAAMP